MLVQGKRPRQLRWYHAGPMLFGDWGTSRLYVLGLCFVAAQHSSFWFMLAMSFLLVGVGWAYSVICRLYPDGGGVYSAARHRSHTLAVIGALLLCADYVVTSALSALDAFHYIKLPEPALWAAGSMLLIGVVNFFGPTKAGTFALVAALLTIVCSFVVAVCAVPHLGTVRIDPPHEDPAHWWRHFTAIILAISGVEAVANMTGIMVEPVEKTSRRAIWPVLAEIVILNLVLTLAMQAIPAVVVSQWGEEMAQRLEDAKIQEVAKEKGVPVEEFRKKLTPEARRVLLDKKLQELADERARATNTTVTVEQIRQELPYEAHRDDMMHALAEFYVGQWFAVGGSLIFGLLLLSAANTAITDLVSIQYMMARDRELPEALSFLNRWGMPMLPLVVGTAVPVTVVLLVPDVGQLADLYAIGVVGAVAVNLGTSGTTFTLKMHWWERGGMLALAVLMVAIWVTIAYEKPAALFFALGIMLVGLAGRWVAHNRELIGKWLLAEVPLPLAVEPALTESQVLLVKPPPAPVEAPAPYTPKLRLMVATRGNPRLLDFALEQAKTRQAELLILFVRHLAVVAMGPVTKPDYTLDREAQALFKEAQAKAAALGVPVRLLYAESSDVAEAILDFAVTHGADLLLLGATQRGGLWRTMKGDVIQQVAQQLPESTSLLIHA
jgi:amino acid transporter/nucleotide-binding universal stress UspA family protein